MPSPKSCFSRLRKYKFLTFSPVLHFSRCLLKFLAVFLAAVWESVHVSFSAVRCCLFMLRLPVKMLHRCNTSSLPSILWTQHRVAFSSFRTTHAIVLAPIHFVVISFPTMLIHRLLFTSLCLGIWICCSKACVFYLSLLNFLVLISKHFSSLPTSFWILPPSSQVLTKSHSLMSFPNFVTVSITIQCSGHEEKSCRTTWCWLPD